MRSSATPRTGALLHETLRPLLTSPLVRLVGAILAVRKGRTAIDMLDLQEAIDRVIAGPQKKARVMSALEQRRTAYHEGGHAVVGRFSENHDPVHKVTIVSRGRMGGYTRFLPEEDRHYMTRAQFEAMIASALGGWVAERLIFGDVSTGASNDIEKATSIARNMVTTYGMSDVVGPLALTAGESGTTYSERVAEAIDAEVRTLIDAAAQQAEQILMRQRDVLDALAARLLDVETIEGDELEEIFQGGADDVEDPAWSRRSRRIATARRVAGVCWRCHGPQAVSPARPCRTKPTESDLDGSSARDDEVVDRHDNRDHQ